MEAEGRGGCQICEAAARPLLCPACLARGPLAPRVQALQDLRAARAALADRLLALLPAQAWRPLRQPGAGTAPPARACALVLAWPEHSRCSLGEESDTVERLPCRRSGPCSALTSRSPAIGRTEPSRASRELRRGRRPVRPPDRGRPQLTPALPESG